MSLKLIAAVAGAGVVAELVRRHYARHGDQVPAQVSEQAARALHQIRVSPCGPATVDVPRDYTALYIAQKQALIAQYGSAVEHNCGDPGLAWAPFVPCVPLPSKSIPTPTVDCTLAVIEDWTRVADRLREDGAFGKLVDDLRTISAALAVLGGQVRTLRASSGGSAKLPADLNRRIWSALGRLAIVLQGVLIHHGDIEAQASAELVKTLASPSSYVGVVTDAAGWVIGGVAGIAGDAAGRFLASNLGALVVVAGAGYVLLRRSL